MRFGMPSHGTHQVNKRYRVRPRTETNRHLPTGADPSKTHNSWKPHLLRKKEPLRRLSQPMYCFPPQPIRLAWSCGRGIGDRGSKVNRKCFRHLHFRFRSETPFRSSAFDTIAPHASSASWHQRKPITTRYHNQQSQFRATNEISSTISFYPICHSKNT